MALPLNSGMPKTQIKFNTSYGRYLKMIQIIFRLQKKIL